MGTYLWRSGPRSPLRRRKRAFIQAAAARGPVSIWLQFACLLTYLWPFFARFSRWSVNREVEVELRVASAVQPPMKPP